MSQLPADQLPLRVSQLEARYQASCLELAALGQLAQAGFSLAPLIVIPAEVEEAFYRLNNLPAQLADLFEQVDLSDPDEDDIEELEPQAQALFHNRYLLDEFIDVFYEAIKPLASSLHIRRPAQLLGLTAMKGRPSLLALKALWAQDWRFEELMQRLSSTGRLGFESRPIVLSVHGEPASSELNHRASSLLGSEVNLYAAGAAITDLLFVSKD